MNDQEIQALSQVNDSKVYIAQSKRYTTSRIVYRVLKRTGDIILSGISLIVLLPLFILISIAIRFEDGSDSAIYKCVRLGKNGKEFMMYKFRSMRKGADNIENMLTPEQLNKFKKEYKLDNDPRITRVGKFLRKTSLDELPQLLNILRGELSMVGPRPVVMEESYKYGKDRDKFLSVTPGLTGYWQAYARNNADYESGKRQEMELYYIENCSMWLDLKIIAKTFEAVAKKTGL